LVRLSFFDAHIVAGTKGFVGLKNYSDLYNSKFLAVLGRTFVYVGGSIPISIIFALLGAVLLNQNIPGKRYLWILIFIPWAIPHSISAILWRWLIHSEYGLLNHILMVTGLIDMPINFLGRDLAMASNIVLRIWKSVPFAIITFIAGLQAIPEELYEAAWVDGCKPWQSFIYITVPSLRDIIMITTLLLGIWSFTTFDLIWVLTEGGPLSATEILPIAIYKEAFKNYNAGLASAMGLISVVITLSISIIYFRMLEKDNPQND
jgi:multiple sugar transport system permease protein